MNRPRYSSGRGGARKAPRALVFIVQLSRTYDSSGMRPSTVSVWRWTKSPRLTMIRRRFDNYAIPGAMSSKGNCASRAAAAIMESGISDDAAGERSSGMKLESDGIKRASEINEGGKYGCVGSGCGVRRQLRDGICSAKSCLGRGDAGARARQAYASRSVPLALGFALQN